MTTTGPTTSRRHRARYHALGLGLHATRITQAATCLAGATGAALLIADGFNPGLGDTARTIWTALTAIVALFATDAITEPLFNAAALRLRALRIKETRRTDPATWTTAQIETALNLNDIAHLTPAKRDAA